MVPSAMTEISYEDGNEDDSFTFGNLKSIQL